MDQLISESSYGKFHHCSNLCVLLYHVIIHHDCSFVLKKTCKKNDHFHGGIAPLQLDANEHYSKIAITVDFSGSDSKAINKAIAMGGTETQYVLLHVLESTNAVVYGEEAFDMEREQDFQYLKKYADQLKEQGYNCEMALGFGNPKTEIPNLVNSHKCDLLVMGTHGHKTFKDILLGATIDSVRHNVNIPLLLV